MTKLTDFLIRCRMTQMVSNQIMLKIIKKSIISDNLEKDTFEMLRYEWEEEKFYQFLLLFNRQVQNDFPAINYLDDEYPDLLRTIYNPPALLFFSGKIALLKNDCIAIVGARQATDYSFRCISGLVPRLVNRYTIVSGLARGVDACAHKVTLKNHGQTIAVVGSSLDVAYPSENEALQRRVCEEGLVISEYPQGSTIEPWHFPQRNRIIAGLSQKVIITEAKKRSGSLITANLAVENGREVYAIPGQIDAPYSRGCNRLIEEGATPLIDFESL